MNHSNDISDLVLINHISKKRHRVILTLDLGSPLHPIYLTCTGSKTTLILNLALSLMLFSHDPDVYFSDDSDVY